MAISDEHKKAFDFVQDVTKQLIALATGVIGITITFLHDLVPSGTSNATLHLVEIGWGLYVVSILFGLGTLLQLSGHLAKDTQPTVYDGGTRLASGLQILTFLAATALVIAFGIGAAGHVTH